MAALMRDKKVKDGRMRFIVLDRIGEGAVDTSLSRADLEEGARLAAAAP